MFLSVLVGAAFILGTIALVFVAYFLMRFVTGGTDDDRTRELASSVIFRVSALHGLILALVFAQQMVEYQQLKFESVQETSAIADIYNDAGRYGLQGRSVIQSAISDYTRIVVETEWEALGRTGRLEGAAWGAWNRAYEAILDLTPENARQESLRDNMLDRVHHIAEIRDRRQNHGTDSISGMFWLAAVAGVFLIALAYYSYPPTVHNLVLISIFGAFTGIVLSFIFSFSNPYSEPGELSPDAYRRLLETDVGRVRPG